MYVFYIEIEICIYVHIFTVVTVHIYNTVVCFMASHDNNIV